jgi:signal transduction histidine kinase
LSNRCCSFQTRERGGRAIGVQSLIAIDRLIDDVIAAERGVIDASHCTVEKNIDNQLLPVRGDAVTLTQAIQNLISNAAKYGKSARGLGYLQ